MRASGLRLDIEVDRELIGFTPPRHAERARVRRIKTKAPGGVINPTDVLAIVVHGADLVRLEIPLPLLAADEFARDDGNALAADQDQPFVTGVVDTLWCSDNAQP